VRRGGGLAADTGSGAAVSDGGDVPCGQVAQQRHTHEGGPVGVAVMGRPKMNSHACDLFKQKFK
jgi:hypothetical protein